MLAPSMCMPPRQGAAGWAVPWAMTVLYDSGLPKDVLERPVEPRWLLWGLSGMRLQKGTVVVSA